MDKEYILNKILDAKDKLDILKRNVEDLGMYAALKDAATLRENVCNDQEIIDGCNSDVSISTERKNILQLIRSFQIDLITKNIRRVTENDISCEEIKDFKKAKADMSYMIDNELKKELFADYEDNPIFGNIDTCRDHIVTLHRVKRNCDDDKYNVLLMGEYQAGKSTTLDALCDGHHISAIGDGTATSAVLVSVSYAPEERINIRWKSKEQLSLILDKIKIFIPGFNWTSFDLDDINDRTDLAMAIDNLRQSNDCPKMGDGDSKFLMISDFLLKYYSTNELSNMQESLQTVSEVSEITRFPKNGETQWRKYGVSSFSISEGIFVFIDCVECYIPSETLRKLNCTIIDSPGLFNSSYDTLITEQAMIDAHAIMYILPRHKAIGDDNCKSLYRIKDNYTDVHSKLFIVNNLDFTLQNGFIAANLETIKAMFGEDKEVYCYDAQLSYLIQLKKSFDLGEIKENEYSHLMSVTERSFLVAETVISFHSFEEAWAHHTKKYPNSHILGSVEGALYNAGFISMISELESFIAKNKAYAVIVSNGIKPMSRELSSVNTSLYLQFIEPYVSSYDKISEKWNDRILKAQKFQSYMVDLIKDELFLGGGKSLLERVTEDEYHKLFTYEYFQELAEAIARVLYDNKGSLLVTRTLFKRDKELFKKRFTSLATPLIEKEIIDLVSAKISYMRGLINSDQDSTITNLFKPTVEKTETLLENKWESEFKEDQDFLMSNYVDIKKSLSGTWNSTADSNTYNTGVLSSGMINLTLLGGLITQIAVVVTGVATLIASYISAILCDPTFTSLAITLGLGVVGTVISAFAPEYVKNKFVRPLAKEIRPKLVSEGGIGFRRVILDQINCAFNNYVNNLSVDINKMKNDRDIALTPRDNLEVLCFNAAEATVKINKQLDVYDGYRKEIIN